MHLTKKVLHLQEKSCLYKRILRLQENLAKARNLCICNKILQVQEYLSTKCKGACYICKKNLAFTRKACVCKKILPKQEICAFATKSCKSKNICPLNVKVHSLTPFFFCTRFHAPVCWLRANTKICAQQMLKSVVAKWRLVFHIFRPQIVFHYC